MKIGFICNEYPPEKCGGIGIFTRELATALVRAGHQVTVIGSYPGLDKDITEQIDGVMVYRLAGKTGRLGNYYSRLKLFTRVRKLARQNTIELVEVPDFEGGCAFWPRLPVPVVVRLHGTLTYFADEMKQAVSNNTRRLEASALKRASAIASVSQYTADRTKQLFNLDRNIQVIYNSVALPDENRCKHSYKKTGLVAYSGSLIEKKGVFSLAKAWPKVCKQHPDARLLMMGKDVAVNGQSAQSLIKKLAGKYADSIVFTGHISKGEMEYKLAESDLAIYPSFSESFGLAPVEAMALSLPVIYTTLSCGPEIAGNGGGVTLIDPCSHDDIAKGICSLLENKNKRESMGMINRKYVKQHFSLTKNIKQNINFYQDCCNK